VAYQWYTGKEGILGRYYVTKFLLCPCTIGTPLNNDLKFLLCGLGLGLEGGAGSYKATESVEKIHHDKPDVVLVVT